MSVALAEPVEATTSGNTNPTTHANQSTAQAEASKANGRLSHGPATPDGKATSRLNGCKHGLTGAGIVLPPAAAAEVDRREAEFAQDFRPRDAAERELVRQMALGAWRSQELTLRIIQHDARMNASRFANWEQDEQIAAAELGKRIAEDPEAVVAQLKRSSAGCAWLIGRWTLLSNGLCPTDDMPYCNWTEADLTLALNLLGRPLELRHLDDWASRLERLRTQANSGSVPAVFELREILAQEVARLEVKRDEVWEGIEEPMLQGWRAGLEIDLGPEGTRLRRYEAAADRLFRSAWTKLERLRQERGEPLIYRSARAPSHEPAPPPAAAPSEPAAPAPSRMGDPAAELDLWVCGSPRSGINSDRLSQYKTNPARSSEPTRRAP